MLIDGSAVLVPGRLAGPLLALVLPEVKRRRVAGGQIGADVMRLLGELREAGEKSSVPTGSGLGSGRFRQVIVDGVSTSTAANRLGISSEAVRKQCRNGTLRAEQRPDRTWIIDRNELP